MNIDDLNESIYEAERFIKRAKDLKESIHEVMRGTIYGYPTEQGAVKRSSMDLSRALSKLRNNKV